MRRPRPPFIPKRRIERRAERLLQEYGRLEAAPPVPVEDILERHLGLSLAFEDLTAVLGRDDVLGATWLDTAEVVIDHRLDPGLHPEAEGRYRFTVAHEIGHWLLHAPDDDGGAGGAPLHRRRSEKDPLEWQADYFAACLLMPRDMVVPAWHEEQRGAAAGAEATPTARLARRFAVSEQAMRIRLEDLQLAGGGER